jgi:hypothetical protein
MNISKHAEEMIQVRGVTSDYISLHQRFADREVFVGSGCTSSTITPKGVEAMIESGVSRQVADKIRRLAIVYSNDGSIVTILPMVDGKAKNYTRGARKRSKGRHAYRSKEILRRQRRG